MLHFFSEVERSEEEKGGGGFNVSPQIRQIDQFAPAPTPRRTAPGLSGLSGRGRSQFLLTHKKSRRGLFPSGRASVPLRIDFDLMLAKEKRV